MTKRSICFVAWILLSGPVYAYQEATHAELSEAALWSSVLGAPASRIRLGFPAAMNGVDAPNFPNSRGAPRSMLNLVRDGATFEDEGMRPLKHFFNPRTGQPLHITVPNASYPFDWLPPLVTLVNAEAEASPDWALGTSSGIKALVNTYSFKHIRDHFYRALTWPTASVRAGHIGLTLESLGRLMHHIQDMAQPQHVRNDPHFHLEGFDGCLPDAPVGTLCHAYRRLRSPSAYEAWTAGFGKALGTGGYAPVYGPGSDGLSTFVEPRRFWTHLEKGIADYTNRNFLSAGTMLVTPPSLGQSFDVVASDLCNGAKPQCEFSDLDHVVTFWPSSVNDEFRPEASGVNPYAASASIFEWDFASLAPNEERLLTVNRFTFDSDHAFLLPRAVGYSAGIVNYFFRGEMEIALPNEKAYGVVDTGNQCGPPCTFRKIKLLVRNVTPNDEMGAGQLRLVARFRRNTCFRPDLAGEFGGLPDVFLGDQCRSVEEGIAVANAIDVTSVPRNFQGAALEFYFPGHLAIPIDASDLVLQVVFRGVLGEEIDAVAVTTKNIAEPNHFGVGNVSDYVFDDIGDQRYHGLPYQGITTDVPATNFGIAFGGGQTPLATIPLLRGGQFARLAILTDTFVEDVPMTLFYYGSAHDYVFQPEAFELDEATGQYRRSCPVFPRRGLHWDRMVFFPQLRSTSTHGPIGGKSSSRQLKVTHACDLGSGGQHDMTLMTPFAVQDALPWVINF